MNEMILRIDQKAVGRLAFADGHLPDQLLQYEAPERTDTFYSEFYSIEESPLAKTRELQFKQISLRLAPYLKNLKTHLSLDVGCGNGQFVSYFKKHIGSS